MSEAPTTPPAPAIDIQGEIQKAITSARAEWDKQFKEATGHESVKALVEHQMQEQGKLQELANMRATEAANYKARLEQTMIQAEILKAAEQAIDPTTITDLLAGRAKVADDGTVTINGLAVTSAVGELLKAKPFLAKPTGKVGSGAPATGGGQVDDKTKTRGEFDQLSTFEQHKFIKEGGKVVSA